MVLQGYLDEQFIQLEELEDDDNPNFVEEVVTSYFSDSARLIRNINQALWVFVTSLVLQLGLIFHEAFLCW